MNYVSLCSSFNFIKFILILLKKHQAWLRRQKEVLKPNGLLIIHSKTSKFNQNQLATILKEYNLNR